MTEIDPKGDSRSKHRGSHDVSSRASDSSNEPDSSRNCEVKDFSKFSCAEAPLNADDRIDRETTLQTRSARRSTKERYQALLLGPKASVEHYILENGGRFILGHAYARCVQRRCRLLFIVLILTENILKMNMKCQARSTEEELASERESLGEDHQPP
jgi:hypothetical protein